MRSGMVKTEMTQARVQAQQFQNVRKPEKYLPVLVSYSETSLEDK